MTGYGPLHPFDRIKPKFATQQSFRKSSEAHVFLNAAQVLLER
jgi:hypothetical protein